MGATAAYVYQKRVAYVPESVFRLFGDDLNPIFQQNHQNFGSHHMLQINKILKFSYGPDFEVE